MCGRFDTSSLTWQQFHDALAEFGVVPTTARNDAFGNSDVRPTDEQLVARRTADGGWTVDPMRWV